MKDCGNLRFPIFILIHTEISKANEEKQRKYQVAPTYCRKLPALEHKLFMHFNKIIQNVEAAFVSEIAPVDCQIQHFHTKMLHFGQILVQKLKKIFLQKKFKKLIFYIAAAAWLDSFASKCILKRFSLYKHYINHTGVCEITLSIASYWCESSSR